MNRLWRKQASGLWSSFDPVIERQRERAAAKAVCDSEEPTDAMMAKIAEMLPPSQFKAEESI